MPRQHFSLDRLVAAGLLCLVSVTWRLWTPSGNALEIPLADGSMSLPTFFLWMPLFGLIAASSLFVVTGYRWLWWLIAGCLMAAFMMNQHRLQPWAYQSAIYATAFASMDREQAKRWLRPLAASIYLYSAIGKFDFQFSHTVGQQFLETTMNVVGGIPDSWTELKRTRIALLFPASELVIGVGLLIPRMRRPAGWLAIAFHLSLLIILGPWGLDHSNGVLVWNAVLILQVYLLYVSPEAETDPPRLVASRASVIAKIVIVFAILAPLSERHGYWDHWLSWALYSPHSSRVDVEVHDSGIAKLDANTREFFIAERDDDPWHALAMDRWSLDQLGVPIYPQARFQLAVANRMAHESQLGDAIRVIVRGPSDRWTGKRMEQRLIGEKEIRRELQRYWWGGR